MDGARGNLMDRTAWSSLSHVHTPAVARPQIARATDGRMHTGPPHVHAGGTRAIVMYSLGFYLPPPP
jgi:hypothetical protein